MNKPERKFLNFNDLWENGRNSGIDDMDEWHKDRLSNATDEENIREVVDDVICDVDGQINGRFEDNMCKAMAAYIEEAFK